MSGYNACYQKLLSLWKSAIPNRFHGLWPQLGFPFSLPIHQVSEVDEHFTEQILYIVDRKNTNQCLGSIDNRYSANALIPHHFNDMHEVVVFVYLRMTKKKARRFHTPPCSVGQRVIWVKVVLSKMSRYNSPYLEIPGVC